MTYTKTKNYPYPPMSFESLDGVRQYLVSLRTAMFEADLGYSEETQIAFDNPTFTTLTLSGLTASRPVITDASKTLASIAYTGATSFRKNLALETDDSPSFTDLTISAPSSIYSLDHDSFAGFVTREHVNHTTFVWHLPVLDKDLTAPPVSPTTGDRYIVGQSATGAWAGQEDKVAEYNGATWDFYTPDAGTAVFVDDEAIYYRFAAGTGGGSGGGGGSTTFTGLTDTPAAYTGGASKYVAVNAGETALEFVEGGGSSTLMAPLIPMKPAAGVSGYVGNLLTGALTTQASAVNRLDIAPFVTGHGFTCDRVGVAVSATVSGSTCRVVIYDADTDGRPTTMLATSNTIDTTTAAVRLVDMSFTFTAGKMYWVGVWTSAAVTLRVGQAYCSQPLTWSLDATPARRSILRITSAYGATAPDWTYDESQLTAANCPLVLFKVAS